MGRVGSAPGVLRYPRVRTLRYEGFRIEDDYPFRSGGDAMPKLTVDDVGTFEVPKDKRLVLALEDDAHVDVLHACGGNARCTTCRVQFVEGEPDRMTVAERDVLAAKGVSGVRLSCQIVCDHNMTVRAVSRLTGSGRPDPGSTP